MVRRITPKQFEQSVMTSFRRRKASLKKIKVKKALKFTGKKLKKFRKPARRIGRNIEDYFQMNLDATNGGF